MQRAAPRAARSCESSRAASPTATTGAAGVVRAVLSASGRIEYRRVVRMNTRGAPQDPRMPGGQRGRGARTREIRAGDDLPRHAGAAARSSTSARSPEKLSCVRFEPISISSMCKHRYPGCIFIICLRRRCNLRVFCCLRVWRARPSMRNAAATFRRNSVCLPVRRQQ